MKKKLLYGLIGFLILAITGIIGVQYFWIRNAFQVKEAQFDRDVNDVLNKVTRELEEQENLAFIARQMERKKADSIQVAEQLKKEHLQQRRVEQEVVIKMHPRSGLVKHSRVQDVRDTPVVVVRSAPQIKAASTQPSQYERSRRIYLQQTKPRSENRVIIIDGSGRQEFQEIEIPEVPEPPDEELLQWNIDLDDLEEQMELVKLFNEQLNIQRINFDSIIKSTRIPNSYPEFQYYFNDSAFLLTKDPSGVFVSTAPDDALLSTYKIPSPPPAYWSPHHQKERDTVFPGHEQKEHSIRVKARNLGKIYEQIATELEKKDIPIEKRLDVPLLAASLKKNLANHGISTGYEFAIIDPTRDSVIPIQSKGFPAEAISDGYKASLFPGDLLLKPSFLMLHFPDKRTHIFQSLSWLMLGSMIFSIIIVIASLLSIYVMLRQKKISDIKTDFINNMSHEFKTPLATINLATDSILSHRVIGDESKVKAFTGIIKEENSRMNGLVEHVLNMALLDRKAFELELQAHDIHVLLNKVINQVRLQVEKTDGMLLFESGASQSLSEVDEVHLSNVFLNILDNAIKYSQGKVEIAVKTYNSKKQIVISFSDKGIGMSRETQKRIFDKFYRVSTGNIHNIKGFGLGLSYSKAIVLAHKGELLVKSELGKGSTFEVRLPLSTVNQVDHPLQEG